MCPRAFYSTDNSSMLYQARFARDSQFFPLDTQHSSINHLIINHNRAQAALNVGFFIFVDDMFGLPGLVGRRGKCLVDDLDLRGMYGPFAIKTHTRSHTRITATGFGIANSHSNAIYHSDAGSARRCDTFRFGVIIVEELLTTQFLRPYIASKINE